MRASIHMLLNARKLQIGKKITIKNENDVKNIYKNDESRYIKHS